MCTVRDSATIVIASGRLDLIHSIPVKFAIKLHTQINVCYRERLCEISFDFIVQYTLRLFYIE